ncbi:MAG: hypothetical protein ABII71_05005 [Candidatus Micrarchaeota archaeon]
MNRTYWIFSILLLANIASCAGPVLQIGDFDVYPESVYPSTEGQLRVTVHNSGSETATGASIYYDYSPGDRWSIFLGDVGANSEAITSIPFKVPEKTDTGIMLLELTIYYNGEDGTSLKTSKASIPISVSQHQILEIDTLGMSKDTIRKGETLDVELEIMNTGGVMNNVVISSPDGSAFSLVGTTSQRVGSVASGSSANVTVSVVASSSADEGKYTIPLKVTFNDALQNEISETVGVGPVLVMDSSSLFRVFGQAKSGSEIGSELIYEITIENRGSSTQSATLIIDDNDIFTPIGSNMLYFDSIMPGEERSETIRLGIDAGSSSGYYILPMTLKTNGEDIEYDSGIVVEATPEIVLTTETSSSDTGGTEATIRIANSGNTPIRAVYVYAESTESLRISGEDEKFIGTLNVDDFATFQVSVQGQGELPITIEFKDNDNEKHTISRLVSVGSDGIMVLSESEAMAERGARPGGGGFSPIFILGGIALLAVLYFGYRKWKQRKGAE